MASKIVYISHKEGVMGGTPVISGTRIPMRRIYHLLEQGYTEENLLKEFEGVSRKKIRGAVAELASLGLKSLTTQ